jgi:hypothetical protein
VVNEDFHAVVLSRCQNVGSQDDGSDCDATLPGPGARTRPRDGRAGTASCGPRSATAVLGARHESCVIAGQLHRCRSALSPGESPQSLGQEVPWHRRRPVFGCMGNWSPQPRTKDPGAQGLRRPMSASHPKRRPTCLTR